MKQILFLMMVSMVLFSCDKDGVVLPIEETCNLTFYGQERAIPDVYNSTNNYTFYKDSIVGLYHYSQNLTEINNRMKYTYDHANRKINSETRSAADNALLSYGTYYLNESGYIDSFVLKNGTSNNVTFRKQIVRSANNQVTKIIDDYNTYGYETLHYYDNDDYSFSLLTGFGSVSLSDSIVYTFDMTKPNNGSATFLLENLYGKASAHHITNKQTIDRATLNVKTEERYTIAPLDADGNLTTVIFERDNNPSGSFIADESINRTYSYNCE